MERDRQILRIALPSIVSNITVPLLGLIDVAITGHLGAAAYIGALAVGSMLFNIVYWIFAFLRMGTSGLTSQAFGSRRLQEVARLLVRSLAIALAIALLLIALQVPIRQLAWFIMRPTPEIGRLATLYFSICIWGAPAMLGVFSLNGWYIGLQNSRIPMLTAIVQNVVNIAVSLPLVFCFHLEIRGVALGTLIAQWSGFLMSLLLCWHIYGKRLLKKHLFPQGTRCNGRTILRELFPKQAMTRFFQLNKDIFFRTICLVSVMLFFTSAGSWQGEIILAVNTLLMQLYLLVSYVMDGFANAAEAMSGKYYGAGNQSAYRQTVAHCFLWGGVCMLLFTLVYVVGGKSFLGLLTNEQQVVAAASEYTWWAYLIPVCSIGAFIWDGVFIGITASRQMFLSSLVAAVTFFMLYLLLHDQWANHGLWLAYLTFLFMRGAVQTVLYFRSLSTIPQQKRA